MPLPSGQWFNWRTNAYSTLNANPLKLSVNRNDAAAAGPVNYNAKTDVQVLNQDINFIHTEWSGPCLPKSALGPSETPHGQPPCNRPHAFWAFGMGSEAQE